MRVLCTMIALATFGLGTARAEEPEEPRKLDWQYDLGLTLPTASKFPHRFLFRWNTESYDDGADIFTVQYGRGWRWSRHVLMKLALGYAGTVFDDLPSRHELVLTFSKDMAWDHDRMRLKMEGAHFLGGDGYRYRGHYAFDWWFFGVHLAQEDRNTAIGFQLTSGPNPEIPLRIEGRHSFEILGDGPAYVTRIVLVMDTD